MTYTALTILILNNPVTARSVKLAVLTQNANDLVNKLNY